MAENAEITEAEPSLEISENVESVDNDKLKQDTQPTESEAKPEGEPPKIPLRELVKERKKKQEAISELDRLKVEAQAMKNELDLFKLTAPVAGEPLAEESLVAPNPNDYLDDDEWNEASEAYHAKLREKIHKEAQEAVQATLQNREQEAQTITQQKEQEQASAKAYEEYLDKADSLGINNFLELEEKIKGPVWQPWFFDMVIQNVPNAHQLIATLGNNPEKAKELAASFDSNNMAGGIALIKYAESIDPIKSNSDPLPEPDSPIEGGAGAQALTDFEAEMDKSRDQLAKDSDSGAMNRHMQRVREIKKRHGHK